jgi:hypothetical protein
MSEDLRIVEGKKKIGADSLWLPRQCVVSRHFILDTIYLRVKTEPKPTKTQLLNQSPKLFLTTYSNMNAHKTTVCGATLGTVDLKELNVSSPNEAPPVKIKRERSPTPPGLPETNGKNKQVFLSRLGFNAVPPRPPRHIEK